MSSIIYKTALNMSEMQAKINLGMEKFEIHTDENFIMKSKEDIMEDIAYMLATLPDVVTVHTPLDSDGSILGYDSVDLLRAISNENMMLAFKNSLYMAELLSKAYGHPINVIVHTNKRFECVTEGVLENKIIDIYGPMLDKHPNVNILFENTTPLEKVYGHTLPVFRNGVTDEPVKMAQYFNKLFCSNKPPRFFTLIDTCHAIITARIYSRLNATELTEEEFLRKLFAEYSPVCKYVHLAHAIDIASNPEDHGIGFKRYEEELEKLMSLIEEFVPDADICLEIKEKDYRMPINAVYTAGCIKKRSKK